MLDGVRRDLTTCVRGLVKTPGFTAAALVTLALGIGATSALFSVVKSVLLTPLPYADPARRVMIWSRWISFDKTWVSDRELMDYRQFLSTVTAVAGWGIGQRNLTGDGEPVRVSIGQVTANVFDVLGVVPEVGRGFTADEDRPNGPPAAVLGYPLWQSRYGGDPAVVGRTILLNDVPVKVVGVMPRGFRLPTDFTEDAAEPTELWVPLQIDEARLQRGSHGYYAAAVLAPGQSVAALTAELRALAVRLTQQGEYPDAMQFSAFGVGIDDEIRGGVRPALRLLAGAVACLLLIACANVANLLLVRADVRTREMAVRMAIGAAPERLLRQLLTESLVLAAVGGALGLGLAAGGLRILAALDPTTLPTLTPPTLDGGVVAFTLALAMATTLLFGLAPARRALGLNLADALRDGSQQSTLGRVRQRLRGALVIGEVALAVVLVVGAGLMIRSLSALGRLDLGFEPDRVLTMRLSLPQARYDTSEKVVSTARLLLERVRALPGVEAAGVVRALPLATTIGDFGLDIEGYVETPGRNAKGDWQIVSDGAFEAMRQRLVRGRWITGTDTTDSQLIAVVNETMARTYWPGVDAVGGRLRIGSNMSRPWLTVVGIVADERHNGVTGIVKEKFFVPHAQWHVSVGNAIRNVFLVVRTTGDPLALAAPARDVVRAVDPNLPVANVRPMTDVVSTALATPRLTGFLLGTFAAIALALSAVGLYGVLSYLVAERTREIGIRLAMGAGRREILRMVYGQGLVLTGLGLAAGLAAALAATRLMRAQLFGVEPADPLTFVAVSAAMIGIASVASLLPAVRATRVDPMVALRD